MNESRKLEEKDFRNPSLEDGQGEQKGYNDLLLIGDSIVPTRYSPDGFERASP